MHGCALRGSHRCVTEGSELQRCFMLEFFPLVHLYQVGSDWNANMKLYLHVLHAVMQVKPSTGCLMASMCLRAAPTS